MTRRALTVVGAVVFCVALSATMYWAGTNAVVPPALPEQGSSAATYKVESGTVERTERLSVAASWSTVRTLFAGAGGVVTSVPQQPGSVAESGQVVATVNLQPVVAVAGTVPMFRTLKAGVKGPDVVQWQEFLKARGLLAAPAGGTFDAATAAATRRFRMDVGAGDASSIGPESLLFVPEMPARLVVLPAVGDRLAPGDVFVRILASAPDFTASVASSERADLRTGMDVTIVAPDGGRWPGKLGTFQARDEGGYEVAITGTLCGADCDAVPVEGQTLLSATIELVPKTSGVVVPESALTQQPSGQLAVTLADGSVLPVRIVAESDGFAIVEGLEAGTVIRLPAAPSR